MDVPRDDETKETFFPQQARTTVQQGKRPARRHAPRACPTCGEVIAADDLVVSTRGRPTVHVRCWTPGKLSQCPQESADNNLSA